MPPHLLAVVHRPVTLRCRATDVDEHRFRAQLYAPPRPLNAAAEVDLVPEHEERRVKGADLVDRLASHQEHGADQEAPLPAARGQGGAPEPAWRRAADRRRAGPPARGHAHHRHVRRPSAASSLGPRIPARGWRSAHATSRARAWSSWGHASSFMTRQ